MMNNIYPSVVIDPTVPFSSIPPDIPQVVATSSVPDQRVTTLAVDIDGVLANFIKALYDGCNKCWPGLIEPDYVQHDWALTDKLQPDMMERVWKQLHDDSGLWMNLSALPGAEQLRRHLNYGGYRGRNENILYVTQRLDTAHCYSNTALWDTNWWLQQQGLVRNNTSTIVVKSSADKAYLYTLLGVRYSIDDKIETVEQCNKIKGHNAYLLDQPWNQAAQHLPRVYSVAQFLEITQQ